MIKNLEEVMYQMSDFFMAPVLILLAILFAYSLISLGSFTCQAWQRRSNRQHFKLLLQHHGVVEPKHLRGFPLASLFNSNRTVTRDELDIAAFEDIEGVRTVSRLAPMLGLIATMVPMGPALRSLADGNVQGISENLIVAFSAVIFGLVIASITFWIASVKKRWLASEFVAIATTLDQVQAMAAEVQ